MQTQRLNKPETEASPADCPECSADSPGLYQDRELIMSEFCDICKTIFNMVQEARLIRSFDRTE